MIDYQLTCLNCTWQGLKSEIPHRFICPKCNYPLIDEEDEITVYCEEIGHEQNVK